MLRAIRCCTAPSAGFSHRPDPRAIRNLERCRATHLGSAGSGEFRTDSRHKLEESERHTQPRSRMCTWRHLKIIQRWNLSRFLEEEEKKNAEFPLCQCRKVLILNYSVDFIFFFNLDTFYFGRKFRQFLDAGRIFSLSKNVITASLLD